MRSNVVFLHTFIFLALLQFPVLSLSVTVEFTPAEQLIFDRTVVTCVEPGGENGCPQIAIENILEAVLLEPETVYHILRKSYITEEEGLLITLKFNENGDSEDVRYERRFVPLSKLGLSEDENFYMCDEGQEYFVNMNAKTNLIDMGFNEDDINKLLFTDYRPSELACDCFWAPQSFFDELEIDKIKKPKEEPPKDEDIIIGDPEAKTPIYKNDGSVGGIISGVHLPKSFFPRSSHSSHHDDSHRQVFNPYDPLVPNVPNIPMAPVSTPDMFGSYWRRVGNLILLNEKISINQMPLHILELAHPFDFRYID